MKIERYASKVNDGGQSDEFGAIEHDGSVALRVQVANYGNMTMLNCPRGYRGSNLVFDGSRISDPNGSYAPVDADGRKLTVEIKPPISGEEERYRAATMLASAVLDPTTAGGLLSLPGEVAIYLC